MHIPDLLRIFPNPSNHKLHPVSGSVLIIIHSFIYQSFGLFNKHLHSKSNTKIMLELKKSRGIDLIFSLKEPEPLVNGDSHVNN